MRKYTGNSDGNAGRARPGTVRFADLCARRWKFTNLGIYANRSMRSPEARNNDPKWLSVHATGRAVDLGYTSRASALEAWAWFLQHTKELGIEEIHDYAFDANVKDKELGWGRGYRCSRGEGERGVKIFTATDNAGSRGGRWLHVELSPAMADDADRLERVWRSLPRPG